MTTALAERPIDLGTGNGGLPARRAVVRWAWRLFRREWRQQLLVLALLVAALAAATLGEAVGSTAAASLDGTVGRATFVVHLPGAGRDVGADLAAAQQYFGTAEVITHRSIPVPGAVETVDIRAQDPNGPYGHVMLRLLTGRYPTGPDEVAVTPRAARIFGLHVGGDWPQDGRTLRVVGTVENPAKLGDTFALVAPGQLDRPVDEAILLRTTEARVRGFHPSNGPVGIEGRPATERRDAAILILILSTVGLLFVGLVAVAGFTVMAQRRLRALGMLRSLGATDAHVRLVMLANGAAVGATAAIVGTAAGLGAWLALAPHLETVVDRRIDPFQLPWWALAAAMALAVVTSLAAAWWPARAAARVPVVAALSGRPPRPRPAHHFALAACVLLVAGPVLLGFARQHRPLLILGGILATALGILLIAPLAIGALARLARRAPIGIRLALRDLARYRARSGAALGAVTLAVGIAAAIAVAATASQVAADETSDGNLPANQLLVYVGPDGPGPLPAISPAQLQVLQSAVDGIAASIHANATVPLQAAIDPKAPDVPAIGNHGGGKPQAGLVKPISEPDGRTGYNLVRRLFVATPALLHHYGIDEAQVDPTADVLTGRSADGLQLAFGGRNTVTPKVQIVSLPTFSSAPTTLLTPHAIQAFGLQAAPAAWLVETPQPLTTAQIDAAEKAAAAGGFAVETRPTGQSLSRLRNDATGAGVVAAFAVLAMTVGLIRSETSGDLRILAAAGAAGRTRRTITGATAGALALLGAVLGTAGAYAALVAWYHHRLHPLTQPPTADLLVLLVGLPLAAAAGGWLLAGRQPPGIARQPLE